MKTEIYGTGISWEDCDWLVGPPADPRFVATHEYLKKRFNTELKCPTDLPGDAKDGKYTGPLRRPDGNYVYTYTEGPKL